MKALPTARASLARLEAAIAEETNSRNRLMLDIFRRHWWGEVTNDMAMIMATLPENEVHYRFDGHPYIMGEGVEFHTAGEARAMYQQVIDQGVNAAGPFEEERWGFGDWGLMFEGILYGIYYGRMFADKNLDPAQLYLISYRSVSLHPMDVEKRLMLGEIVYSGKPLMIEPADEIMMKAMTVDLESVGSNF